MKKEESLENLKNAIIRGNTDKAVELVEILINMQISFKEILNRAILEGAEEAGKLYENDEYFLPDLLMTGDAINLVTERLKITLKEKSELTSKGTILIGTVEGDIHDIGKSLVISLLHGQGFEVIDLGSDVRPEEFVRMAKEVNPILIGLSGLMTMSISKMIETVDLLKKENISSRIIVGGGILSRESCEMIGADDYAKDGWEGVKKIKGLISINEG
jgi:methylmalonyl-CoA mutase cobalamin-binding domain/chain